METQEQKVVHEAIALEDDMLKGAEKLENPDSQEQPEKEKPKKDVKKEIVSWIITLAAAVVIALVIRTFLFEPVRVDGSSMNDTLANNEIMFVTKPEYLLGSPKRGDVIICRYPGRGNTLFVKRLMALPGDTIEIMSNVVYINGEQVNEDYLTPQRNQSGYTMQKLTLGEDEYFVMGDNRDNSHDSRSADVGPLKREAIVGHVQGVFFPFDKLRGVQ